MSANNPNNASNELASIRGATLIRSSPDASISSASVGKPPSRKGRWIVVGVLAGVAGLTAAAILWHNKLQKNADQAHMRPGDAAKAYEDYQKKLDKAVTALPPENDSFSDLHRVLAKQLWSGSQGGPYTNSLDIKGQGYAAIPHEQFALTSGCSLNAGQSLPIEKLGFNGRRVRWENLNDIAVTLPKGVCGSEGSKTVDIPLNQFGKIEIPVPAPISMAEPSRSNNVRISFSAPRLG